VPAGVFARACGLCSRTIEWKEGKDLTTKKIKKKNKRGAPWDGCAVVTGAVL
jgi:hypothetical protein